MKMKLLRLEKRNETSKLFTQTKNELISISKPARN